MKKTALIIMLCTLAAFAQAQRFEYVYKGVAFKCKIDDNRVCITAFNTKATDVTIPASVIYKGMKYPVRQVSTFLNGVNYLTVNLTLEEGIEDVDKYCFNEFRKLQKVALPASLRHIGKNAFRDNKEMTLTMPSSFNEQSIRSGVELFPSGGGEIIDTNYHLAEAERRLAAQKEKEEARQSAEVQKELEKRDRQLAIMQEENKRLKEKAEKEEKKKEDEEKKEEKKTSKGGLISRFSNKLLTAYAQKAEKQAEKQAKKEAEEAEKQARKAGRQPEQQPVPVPQETPETEIQLADVDMDIPVTAHKNQDLYCVIIANEKYEDVPEVEYARRDGEVFKEYCIRTLGVPEKQVKVFLDASYTDIKRALNWMENIAGVTEGNSRMLFYYAGHGMPDEKDKTAYLIPTDGFPKDITTCFKLSELYGRLGKMRTQNVTVLLDACFSGVKRGSGQALVAARGIAIKPKAETLSGNLVVFTAASDDETALAYQEKHHGMFTYFILDKLKESKGKMPFGELFSTVAAAVKKNSMLENDKLQTPSVNVSAGMQAKWKDLHF